MKTMFSEYADTARKYNETLSLWEYHGKSHNDRLADMSLYGALVRMSAFEDAARTIGVKYEFVEGDDGYIEKVVSTVIKDGAAHTSVTIYIKGATE